MLIESRRGFLDWASRGFTYLILIQMREVAITRGQLVVFTCNFSPRYTCTCLVRAISLTCSLCLHQCVPCRSILVHNWFLCEKGKVRVRFTNNFGYKILDSLPGFTYLRVTAPYFNSTSLEAKSFKNDNEWQKYLQNLYLFYITISQLWS